MPWSYTILRSNRYWPYCLPPARPPRVLDDPVVAAVHSYQQDSVVDAGPVTNQNARLVTFEVSGVQDHRHRTLLDLSQHRATIKSRVIWSTGIVVAGHLIRALDCCACLAWAVDFSSSWIVGIDCKIRDVSSLSIVKDILRPASSASKVIRITVYDLLGREGEIYLLLDANHSTHELSCGKGVARSTLALV